MIVEDILYAGFRIAGILGAPGRGMGADEIQDGLRIANSMLSTFRSERLLVYAIDRQEYTITPAKPSYTIGPGGDIALDRPIKIERAGLVLLSSSPPTETSLRVCLTEQEWAEVAPKALQSTLPSTVYYQRKNPLGVLWIWPIPTVANKFALYPWVTLSKFNSSQDVIEMPEEYQELVEYNLGVRLAAQFPERQKISPFSVDMARSTIARVKGLNTPDYLMRTELGCMGYDQGRGSRRWNILINDYNQ